MSAMRTTQQMSITPPLELARMVKFKVEAGGYASESEVIREGLRALQERDAVVERWLQDQVGPSLDRYRADRPGARRSTKRSDASLPR
jgi:antitoxin ParD1/3/4